MGARSTFRTLSSEQVQWKIINDFPKGTRIIRADKVTEGGILGFFAKRYYEVTVEEPDPQAPVGVGAQPAPTAAGVAALLIEADLVEERMRHGGRRGGVAVAVKEAPAAAPAVPVPHVSTDSAAFEDLMEGISRTVRDDDPSVVVPVNEDVPAILRGPGDVVMVVGVVHDALTAARSLATGLTSAEIRTAGSAMMDGFVHVVGKTGVSEAKEAARSADRPVIIAFGIGQDGSVRIPALTEIDADQVWLAVDATKKAADTEAWVKKVIWASPADALVVLGAHDTLTPQTVNELKIPVGWVDGRPAESPVLY